MAGPTGGGTVGTLEFSRDPQQSCLYLGDLTNFTIYVLNRSNLQELNRVGTGGRQAGHFHWPHAMSTDSDGNIYMGEVDTAGRVQKFLRYGATGCSGNRQHQGWRVSPIGSWTERSRAHESARGRSCFARSLRLLGGGREPWSWPSFRSGRSRLDETDRGRPKCGNRGALHLLPAPISGRVRRKLASFRHPRT